MLHSWMLEKAGAVCVASEVSNERGLSNVGVETIFEWNPDFLFCTSSTALDYSVKAVLEDPAWSAVEAVKNGRVYNLPSRIDSWDMPGISCSLATMFMLHRMYPDYFPLERLESEIDEYYMFMFGRTFDSGYLGYELEG